MTDETLIEIINEAASLEQQRQNKQRKTAAWKQSKLNEIHTEHSSETAKRDAAAVGREEVPPTLKKKQGKGKELDVGSSKCIEDSKAEVLEIKKMFLETMEAAKLHHHTGTRPPTAVRMQDAKHAKRKMLVSHVITVIAVGKKGTCPKAAD